MSHSLWSPGFIGSVCLKNRIIRSAVNDAQADADGACTPLQIALLRELTAHGVGGIITGHIYVHRSGMAGNRQLGLDRDELIPRLAQMALSSPSFPMPAIRRIPTLPVCLPPAPAR